MDIKEDLTFGKDLRGDNALFIESSHIDGWEIDDLAKQASGYNLRFFRVLNHGQQTRSHGWIENGRIVQWG